MYMTVSLAGKYHVADYKELFLSFVAKLTQTSLWANNFHLKIHEDFF